MIHVLIWKSIYSDDILISWDCSEKEGFTRRDFCLPAAFWSSVTASLCFSFSEADNIPDSGIL